MNIGFSAQQNGFKSQIRDNTILFLHCKSYFIHFTWLWEPTHLYCFFSPESFAWFCYWIIHSHHQSYLFLYYYKTVTWVEVQKKTRNWFVFWVIRNGLSQSHRQVVQCRQKAESLFIGLRMCSQGTQKGVISSAFLNQSHTAKVDTGKSNGRNLSDLI